MRTLLTITLAIATLTTTTIAHAQPTSRQPADKSPGTAFLLSLGSTLAPIAIGIGIMKGGSDTDSFEVHLSGAIGGLAVISLGLTAGPSIGYFYAGEVGRGLLDMGIRGALLGGAWALASHSAEAVFALAIPAMLYGVYSILDAAKAAKRTNARNDKKLSLAPLVTPTPSGDTAYGVALVGRF